MAHRVAATPHGKVVIEGKEAAVLTKKERSHEREKEKTNQWDLIHGAAENGQV